jgi:hypothetical protein
LYDTYGYFKAQKDFIYKQIDVVQQIQNYLKEVESPEDASDNELMKYSRLHVAKYFWELRRDEALLIEQMDKMTVTKALYQNQTFFDNKT